MINKKFNDNLRGPMVQAMCFRCEAMRPISGTSACMGPFIGSECRDIGHIGHIRPWVD